LYIIDYFFHIDSVILVCNHFYNSFHTNNILSYEMNSIYAKLLKLAVLGTKLLSLFDNIP